MNVDVHRRLLRGEGSRTGPEGEAHLGVHASYLSEALDKLTELDCTTDFRAFRQELLADNRTRSLPLILHHAKEIIQVFIDHLRKPESACVPSLLRYVEFRFCGSTTL